MSLSKLPAVSNDVWDSNKLMIGRIQKAKSSYCTRNLNPQLAVREHRLDAMFLTRKHKLAQITRENRQIHQRIFTQKSTYSFTKPTLARLSHNKSKQKLSRHVLQMEELNRQFQKKSELSTAFQTVCRKETTLPEMEPTEQASEALESPKKSRVSNKQVKQLRGRTRSCKQIKNPKRATDIIII